MKIMAVLVNFYGLKIFFSYFHEVQMNIIFQKKDENKRKENETSN